jgi:alpha,alpha-trehalase
VLRRWIAAGVLCALGAMPACHGTRPDTPLAAAADPLAVGRLAPVRAYIARGWGALTRSNRELPEAARDPKVPLAAGARWPVYLAPDEDLAAVTRRLQEVLAPPRLGLVELRPLPRRSPAEVQPPGLLYLPDPYVVPGGRFNEMYGWDSYFIVLGLLRDGQIERARQQTDNFLYEVERYSKVLNANRSYYLTRSQPPLLSGMVRAVFAATHDRRWLGRARAALEATHRFWTSAPHLAGDTGLSRYFDTGAGPAPEVVAGERDAAGRTHYQRVQAFLRDHPQQAEELAGYYDRKVDRLTPLFYVGDRSMRESGFDPSDRFGSFGVDVIHFAPVCLNVLLAVLESDLGAIAAELDDGGAVTRWRELAGQRRERIDRFLWDEPRGLYLDWNFARGQRRVYPFATTFWPLWAGLASPAQAARVRSALATFERPGGIRTSDRVTGNQWDAPFGWAPLQLFAALGLARQGFTADAARVARSFLTMVVEDFERRGTIVEKYDVERRSSQVEQGIRYGYSENQVGFGWTNGVFLELAATFFPEGAGR